MIRLLLLSTTLLVALPCAVLAQCPNPVVALIRERQLDDARTQAKALLQKNARDHAAHECLGRADAAQDRHRDAVNHFEQAIKIEANVASYHLWLGSSLGDLADSTSKIKLPFLARRLKGEFEKTVQLDPKSVDGHWGLMQFYAQTPGVKGGNMDKAREQAREIMALSQLRGHLALADLANREKKPAEFEKNQLEALKFAPDSAFVWYNLAGWYQNQQRWADAFGIYDRMLKQFPTEHIVHFQIGRTAALSGEQLERGERELKWWMENAPKDFNKATWAGAHHRLGMVYEKQGRKELARTEYREALAIDPANENAKKSLAALK